MLNFLSAIILLIPANLIFILIVFRISLLANLNASTGALYILILNLIYIIHAIDICFLHIDLDFRIKLLITSIGTIGLTHLFNRQIKSWLIKNFNLVD